MSRLAALYFVSVWAIIVVRDEEKEPNDIIQTLGPGRLLAIFHLLLLLLFEPLNSYSFATRRYWTLVTTRCYSTLLDATWRYLTLYATCMYANGHMQCWKHPLPWSQKLSSIEHSQYLDGWPLTNGWTIQRTGWRCCKPGVVSHREELIQCLTPREVRWFPDAMMGSGRLTKVLG
jgi:hypothetical protein